MKKRGRMIGLFLFALMACVFISSAADYTNWQNEYDGTEAHTRYLWNFNSDEISGTVPSGRADNLGSTGPDPKAVLFGGSTFSSGGKFEYGANLTGTTGDQLYVGPLDLTDGISLTVETWARFDTFDALLGVSTLVDKMRGDTSGFKLQYQTNSAGDHLVFFMGDGTAQRFVKGAYTLQTNQWYHLAGTWNEETDTLKVFVNGAEVGSATFAGSTYIDNPAKSCCIGSREYYKDYGMTGTMDGVRISDTAIAFAVPQSPTDWQYEYTGVEANTRYLWNFNSDEISGTVPYGKADNLGSTGPDPKATLFGGSTFSSGGKFEYGANLTGTDGDQLWVGALNLTNSISLTVETWARFDTFDALLGVSTLVDKMRGDTSGFKLQYQTNSAGDHLVFFMGDGTAQRFVKGAYTLQTNQWYHLAGTWNEETDTLKVFVNGAEVGSATFAGSTYIDNPAKSCCIGSREYYKDYGMTGTMDGVRISDAAIAFEPLPMTFEKWLQDHGLSGGDAAENADPDGDGFDNLAEYGLGGNPTNSADRGFSPASSITSDGGTIWLSYTYPQLQSDNTLTYYLELSTNLVSGTWTNAGYTVLGTNTDGYAAGFDAVTNRISTETESQQFIRLRISK